MKLAAVIAAGDRRAARLVYGENKAFLELAGLPLVAHVALTLQSVPEVSSVWIVGNSERLTKIFDDAALRAKLCKPLFILEQFENLYQNAWQSYRHILGSRALSAETANAAPETHLPRSATPAAATAPPQAVQFASENFARDPQLADATTRVFYLSCDIPFATPQEISDFLQSAFELDAPYVAGLVAERSLAPFRARTPDARGASDNKPGIEPALFGVREGRFRQNNLHLVQPALLPNRHYIEELYENRHQKNWREILRMAWKVLHAEEGSLVLIFYFLLAHLALIFDRLRWAWLAQKIRARISMHDYEAAFSRLLRAPFRMVVTQVGGCGIDIDDEADLDAARARYAEWRAQQTQLAETLHGPRRSDGNTANSAAPVTVVRRAASPAALKPCESHS